MTKTKLSPKRKQTNTQDPYIELTEKYKDDPAVRKRIMSILRQREGFPDNFEAEMVGVALDELLDNEKTPVGFGRVLSDYLHAVARHTGACGWRDSEELYNVKEWFTIAIEAMEEEGEPVDVAVSPINELTEAVILIMNSHLTPERLKDKMAHALDAIADVEETDTSTVPALLRAWLPGHIERAQTKEVKANE